MEEFKIEHFMKANGGISFPHYELLDAHESEGIRIRLCDRLGLPQCTVGATLVSKLAGVQVTLNGVNANDEEFDLAELANSIGVNAQREVFVNWYQFDNIDKLTFKDLVKFFHDIWYPASDDLDIFDASLSWFMSVTHGGSIQFIQWSGEIKTGR